MECPPGFALPACTKRTSAFVCFHFITQSRTLITSAAGGGGYCFNRRLSAVNTFVIPPYGCMGDI